MRRLLLCVVVALLATTASAAASTNARFGIQDDAWLRWGPGTLDQRLSTLDSLGVKTVRLTLLWSDVAKRRPSAPGSPNDAAYDWSPFDPILSGLRAHGITPVLTLYGSPRWANGGHAPNWLPKSGFGAFAYAAAKRYPWVRLWTIWNEPNTRTFSVPVSPKLYTQRLLNTGVAWLHKANRDNLVAGGVTSPRKTPSGMSPTAFIAGMRAARAKLDAYAANPYPSSKAETPTASSCAECATLTMARLSAIRSLVTRTFGPKPLWLTEYGYQTNPPDRIFGVSPAKQAGYLGEAAYKVWRTPGVTMLIQFLVRDEPTLGGWQSGLFTRSGVAKPSRRAFALPLAQVSRTELWGQVRPGTGPRPCAVQRWTGSRWVDVGGTRRTGSGGTFRAAVHLAPGTKVRLWSPVLGYASPQLVLS